ncbi:universal stress protein [Aurantibacter crassamenti]|uniref:universal stress protein n=1 Tax=Aurantibacter crassamenti TaxID=1837375 RepID=UPI0019395C8D|nr:universal stress protein [Aurantibacter crassamenti]MBM1106577.1 universal stress protein [Aurantibacter crassamenti]
MMKNILMPTDFSENAWNALLYAKQLFKNTKCNFYIVHVSDFIDSPMNTAFYEEGENGQTQELVESSKKQLTNLLRKIENNISNKNHNYIGLHEHGFFLETIKEHIAQKKINLIVMGTTGVTGMRKRIIGSNSGDVITKVKCNTLIIPKGVVFSVPQEVAFPTDYNIFYSHNILDAITEMLGLCEGNIRVMNVSKADRELTITQQKNREYLFDYLNETFDKNNSFHTITNKSVNAAIQCFVESRDIDMIIMVAKNLNFIQQILFDSLTEKVSFHTSVPFFVIHE